MKYEVFISSPVESLKDERKVVYNSLKKIGYKKIFCSEDEGSKNSNSFKTCLNAVENSELFILLIGKYYGNVPENENHSMTELEYNKAYEKGIDILVFKLHFFDYETRQKEFIIKVENSIDGRFRGKIINNIDELENRIYSDVHQYARDKITDADKKVPLEEIKESEVSVDFKKFKKLVFNDQIDKNNPPLLLLKARINYTHEAGNAQLMKLFFNNYEIRENDLINKSKKFILNDNREYTWYNRIKQCWSLPYSPNFRDNYLHYKYKIKNGDPYTYIFSLENAEMNARNNVLKIIHCGSEEHEAYKNSIIIGRYELLK